MSLPGGHRPPLPTILVPPFAGAACGRPPCRCWTTFCGARRPRRAKPRRVSLCHSDCLPLCHSEAAGRRIRIPRLCAEQEYSLSRLRRQLPQRGSQGREYGFFASLRMTGMGRGSSLCGARRPRRAGPRRVSLCHSDCPPFVILRPQAEESASPVLCAEQKGKGTGVRILRFAQNDGGEGRGSSLRGARRPGAPNHAAFLSVILTVPPLSF